MNAIPKACRFTLVALCVGGFATIILFADQIEMTNGDRYAGKLISVSETDVKFQSEVQGVIKLPREKVSLISFGNKPVVSRSAAPVAPEAASAAIQSVGQRPAAQKRGLQSASGRGALDFFACAR